MNITDIISSWQNSLWWQWGANLIQWSTIFFWGAGAIAWWHLSCKVWWCPRHGRHPIEGTAWHVCEKHHTAAHHNAFREMWSFLHGDSNKLKHGES